MTKNASDLAIEFKDLGNKALLSSKFDEAINYYTKAIELDPTKEVYFANRAQAHLKTESYGLAIADATKAVELNPSYTKAYYRRAVANTAIIKHKEALQDFKTVVDRAPTDPQAKIRYIECQKINRRIAFEKAISVDEVPSVVESLDLTSMTDNYDGPKLEIIHEEKPAEKTDESKLHIPVTVRMTQEFIDEIIELFKVGKLIPRKYVYAIVMQAMKQFRQEPTMVEIKDKVDRGKLTVCGDTHGQFFDLLDIFDKNGKPSADHSYLFNGDFVDRGSWSTEIAIVLYCYKILYPQNFFINRGNHESDSMNKVYGFEGECKHKYLSDQVFKLFSESFDLLPLATLIEDQYLVLHGGLFSRDDVTLDEIRAIDRFKQPGAEGLMMEMLWTDPQDSNGRSTSKRGIGIQFGPDITKTFCKNNNLTAVIRSHEMRMEGYSIEHDGRLITVFSAPNYCDSQGNKGAYINFTMKNGECELEYVTFDAVKHPEVKPMAYASKLMS